MNTKPSTTTTSSKPIPTVTSSVPPSPPPPPPLPSSQPLTNDLVSSSMPPMENTLVSSSNPVATSATSSTILGPKKRIVIAVPGEKFSYNFLMSWTTTLHALWESGKYEIVISPGTSSFLTFARMQTMGLDVRRGKEQKPFNGELDYYAYLTIDPNIVFNAQLVMELLDSLESRPVVAGIYALGDGKSFSASKEFDSDFFITNGGFRCLQKDDLEEWNSKHTDNPFMPVTYTAMGFFAARREVLESLTYPFFYTPLQRIYGENGKELIELCSEDVAFCKNILATGTQICIHTGIRVGHELTIVL